MHEVFVIRLFCVFFSERILFLENSIAFYHRKKRLQYYHIIHLHSIYEYVHICFAFDQILSGEKNCTSKYFKQSEQRTTEYLYKQMQSDEKSDQMNCKKKKRDLDGLIHWKRAKYLA